MANFGDEIVDYSITVPHNLGSANIRFQSALDQDAADESYGINRFLLLTSAGYGAEKTVNLVAGAGDKFEVSKAWKVYGSLKETSTCGNIKLFGGKRVFGEKSTVLIEIPTEEEHDFLLINYTPAFVDSWDAPDFLSFQLDHEPYFTTNRVGGKSIAGGNCVEAHWAAWPTTYPGYSFLIPHSGKSAIIGFEDTLDQA